jgi:hypothetical protein
MRVITFFCICLSIISLSAFAQDPCKCNESDALRPAIGKYFNSGKLDSAAIILGRLSNSPNEACQVVYLDGIAQVNMAKKMMKEARDFFTKEEVIQKKLQCKKLLIRFYNSLAKYYQATNQNDSVSYISLRVIELAEVEKEWLAAARASINISSVFNQQSDQSKSFYYMQQALTYARKSNDTTILAAALARNAGNYFQKYDSTKEKKYLDTLYSLATECIAISRNRPANLIEVPNAYFQLSRYYTVKEDYAKALLFADTSITICPKGVYDFYRHILNGYQQKSMIYEQLKDVVKTKDMADSAYRYAEMFNLQLAVEPLKTIFSISKEQKNYERATWAQERLTKIRDSIFTLEKNTAINELEKKYNQARNEKTIKELTQQKQIYLLLAITGLLAVVAIAFFLRQQSLKHKQKILEAEQRLNRARMNPHFFFNALATLQSFAIRENDGKAIATNLSKFSHIMRETLESTYKEYVTVEQEMDFLNEYLDVQKIRFPQKFKYEVRADKNVEADEVFIPSMIIQPFVENSIEHGFAGIDYPGEVTISFQQQNKDLQVEITDNGKGLGAIAKVDNEHISRASQIIKDRIYLLNIKLKTKASFSIDNGANGKGVVVKIKLPLLYKQDI